MIILKLNNKTMKNLKINKVPKYEKIELNEYQKSLLETLKLLSLAHQTKEDIDRDFQLIIKIEIYNINQAYYKAEKQLKKIKKLNELKHYYYSISENNSFESIKKELLKY